MVAFWFFCNETYQRLVNILDTENTLAISENYNLGYFSKLNFWLSFIWKRKQLKDVKKRDYRLEEIERSSLKILVRKLRLNN